MDGELNQTDFLPLLISISKVTRALLAFRLSALGFYNGQDELLFKLDDKSALQVSVLAEKLTVRPSTVSKMADHLIEKGLVERARDRRDARLTMIRLTPAGIEARRRLHELRQDLEHEIARSLTGEDMQSIKSALVVLEEHLVRRLSRLR